MNANLAYDPALQMFVQPPAQADLDHLRFLRWLAENDRLEHPIAGDSCGLYQLITRTDAAAAPPELARAA
jgi:hypothetical protein